MPGDPPAEILVIGIGSELLGDDAAGRLVAARVEALRLDGVRVRSAVQLVPELVEDLERCTEVVFVDADPSCTGATVRPVVPGAGRRPVTHLTTPESLLELAAVVGVRCRRATLISVPAAGFGLGTGLSPGSRAGIRQAVELVVRLRDEAQAAPTCPTTA